MLDFLFNKKNIKNDFNYFEAIEVDIHSHLIPYIDDGSPNLLTSISLMREMKELGFNKLITTPHISELYQNNDNSILDGLILLKKHIKSSFLGLELTVAAEYMVNDIFEEKLKNNENLLTLPNKHILIEMSHLNEPNNFHNVLAILKAKGYTPVLAHPERYRFYDKSLAEYQSLKNYGCLFQINFLSLLGYYGQSIKECAWLLINSNLIDFVATDIHHQGHIDAIKHGMTHACQHLLNNYPFMNKNLCAQRPVAA
jgi:protein-tyrosine phosphatase